MKSANKLYKESGSELPFKQWLQEQQEVGNLENHAEQKFSADGTTVTVANVDVRYILLAGALLVAGYYFYKKSK